jgi:rare lipoprotein A
MKAALAVLLGITTAGTSLAQTTAAPASPAATPVPGSAKSSDSMEGLAAVYSDKLAGRKTASGEVFNQSKLTAAHPSLAFGTTVKFTNTKSNKTEEVRINDRGPTQAGRVIDMTNAAAAKIGLGKKSMAPVKLEVVSDTPAEGRQVGSDRLLWAHRLSVRFWPRPAGGLVQFRLICVAHSTRCWSSGQGRDVLLAQLRP